MKLSWSVHEGFFTVVPAVASRVLPHRSAMITPLSDLDIAVRLGMAGLTGLAVGIEREWSGHASGPRARFAGVRTFLLLGLVGGVSGAVALAGWPQLGAALTGGAAILAVVAYAVASTQTQDRDGTTEMAALLVLGTGVLCGLGYRGLGGGVAVVAALALAEKSRIQQWVGHIGQVELYAALRFAVLALVVLPLLPVGPYGPHGAIRPRELWSMVLLVSGLDFLGYLARRTAGAERGIWPRRAARRIGVVHRGDADVRPAEPRATAGRERSRARRSRRVHRAPPPRAHRRRRPEPAGGRPSPRIPASGGSGRGRVRRTRGPGRPRPTEPGSAG